MKFKFVGSWDAKYAGININNMSYYFAWRPKECSRWGYLEDWYDGLKNEFSLGRFAYLWHWDKQDWSK
jgi:hypothetical protein